MSITTIVPCSRGVVLTRAGSSVENRPIHSHAFSNGPNVTLVLAGMHGDEPKGVAVALRLIEELCADPPKRAVIVVPVVNPDGYEFRGRRNAGGVDINRNFPTVDWITGSRRSRNYPGLEPASEPETRTVMNIVEAFKPTRIITIHSIDRQRFCNNYDGPGRALATRMARCNGYPVLSSIGYATPGSFGTWAGKERRMATLTLELPSHHSTKRCWADNHRALIDCCNDQE